MIPFRRYVVHRRVRRELFSGKAALATGPYEALVKAAVALGQDTDTTACVAGLRDGIDAIPVRWQQGLRGAEMLRPLQEGLLALRNA